MFLLKNIDIPGIEMSGIRLSPCPLQTQTAKFDLTLMAEETPDTVLLVLEYSQRLFKRETVQRFAGYFKRLVSRVRGNPGEKIAEMAMLSGQEKLQLLVDFNDTRMDYPWNKTIFQLFAEQVEQAPDHTALVGTHETQGKKYDRSYLSYMSYKELNRKSNHLAHLLQTKGVGPDRIVGIMAESSLEMLTGIIGILKAGGAYLPIDPGYPQDRINYMLADSGTKILLTGLDIQGEVSSTSTSTSTCQVSSANLAYIIYTSGTTGKPKGVMVQHRSLVNLCLWHNRYYRITPSDHAAQYASSCFDASVWEIFPYLVMGACVYIVPGEIKLDMEELSAYYERNRITIVFLPTQVCERFISAYPHHRILRLLLTGGDKLRTVVNTNYAVYNNYGPTENTVVTTSCRVKPAKQIPIGKPTANSYIYILDAYSNPVAIGVGGELCISGVGVARGYLNNPELTAERFYRSYKSYMTYISKKLYKSGDLARWLPDGNIEFLGRLDQQVKIRGFRIEPGEIENQLKKHRDVKDAVVMVRENPARDKYLCAYMVLQQSPGTALQESFSAARWKEYLSRQLPHYMIPSFFMPLERIPLKATGKINRTALPEPVDTRAYLETAYAAPKSEIEKKLAKIWSGALSRESIGINDNFFALGGNSLKAMSVISGIHKDLDIKLPVDELFKHPSIGQMAKYLDHMRETAVPFAAIDQVEKKEYYPLSSSQNRFYMLQQMEPSSVAYNMLAALTVEGTPGKEILEKAFEHLVYRHESLRTSFMPVKGEPVQKIHNRVEFKIDWYDLGNSKELMPNAYCLMPEAILKTFVRPFDLSHAPLLRLGLGKCAENNYLLMFDMHHIVFDGLSMNIFLKELSVLLKGEELPVIRNEYKDFASWQYKRLTSGTPNKEESYWLKEFIPPLPVLQLPLDFPRPQYQRFEGNSIPFLLEGWLFKKIRQLSKKTRTTLFMLLLTALNILLARYSEQEDIIIGSPISGRYHKDLEPVMGLMIETLVTRNYPKPAKTLTGFLQEVKNRTLNAYENQAYPFRELIKHAADEKDLSRNPIFDVMLNVQDEDMQPLAVEIPGLGLKPYEFELKISKVDITLTAQESEDNRQIDCSMEYCTALFKQETIQRFTGHVINTLKEMVRVLEDPLIKLSEIDILSEKEKRQILEEFNRAAVPWPGERLIHQLIEDQVEQTPDNISLVARMHITYRELNRKSNELAHRLREKGVKPDTIVALMVLPGVEMIIGLLGILEAGGAYLPIDPGTPQERIQYMLADSGAKILLTGPEIEARETPSTLTSTSTCRVSSANLAYIIYTSGTTGRPKGVLVEHRNLVAYVKAFEQEFRFNAQDNIIQQASYSFDAFAEEIFPILLKGGTITIPGKQVVRDMDLLLEFIIKHNVTIIDCSPLLLNQMNEQDNLHHIPIHTFISGGDVLERKYIRNLLQKGTVYNTYGPTEATICATYYRCTGAEQTSIPLGKPIANYTVYIIDRQTNERFCPVGVPGELCISGAGVTRGYLNNPELTAEKFLATDEHGQTRTTFNKSFCGGPGGDFFKKSPLTVGDKIYKTGDLARWQPGGNIEFLGRIDRQIKIRGYRIEPEEIEGQLVQHGGIKEALVVVKESRAGDQYICAYIVKGARHSQPKKDISVSLLKEFLSGRLPRYMIPAYFIEIGSMPYTLSGKPDEGALPPGGASAAADMETGTAYTPPGSDLEKKLVQIWSEILETKQVGIDDNFFELGGQSILAMRMVSRLKELFNVKIPLIAFFREGTIRKIAPIIAQLQTRQDENGEDHSLANLKLEKVERKKEEL
jgi:amino acid adenylation domain-containing protein